MSQFIPELIKEQTKQGLRYAGAGAGVLVVAGAFTFGLQRATEQVISDVQTGVEYFADNHPGTVESARKVGSAICEFYNNADNEVLGDLLSDRDCNPTVTVADYRNLPGFPPLERD